MAEAVSLNPFFRALQKAGYQGECRDDRVARILNATDNSIYQILPQAVLIPRTRDDLDVIMSVAQSFPELKFTPRGGGTGTNGQSLTEDIVIDTGKYLNKILHIDKAKQEVRLEPGVVLDQLNAALKPYGLFFPVEISPSKSATIGGMVSTDACGRGSTVYGKTGDYIVSLRCLKADGREINTADCTDDPLTGLLEQGYQKACEDLPLLPRGLSGYDIKRAFLHHKLNINRLIAGSEGSLVVLKEIVLRVVPKPGFRAMFVLGYDDFDKALRHVGALLVHKPVGIETIDDHIMALARKDILWPSVQSVFGNSNSDSLKALHFVEFEAHTEESLTQSVNSFSAFLAEDKTPIATKRINEAERAGAIAIRKKCVGLLGNMPGNRRPVPFIEDTAVPPAKLADYIADLRAFLHSQNLVCGLFGHSDAGCLHVRPALDLKLPEDEQHIRSVTDGVVALLKKHGGVLWGEHGKGLRGAYTKELVGTDYYALMQKIKNHFDPHNRLNPGKIAGERLTEIDEPPLRGQFDRQIEAGDLVAYSKSVECNGNGQCFSVMPDDTMCPSYKITLDRKHSPKGRAALLREWLRLDSVDKSQAAEFAPEVHDALRGCLSCKACTSTCPIHVNIPQMKSQFLKRYYKNRLRPLRDYLIAYAERFLPVQAVLPFYLPAFGGLRDIPRPVKPDLKTLMRERGFAFLDECDVAKASNPVIFIQDAYTTHYEPYLVLHVLNFLRKLGYAPLTAPLFDSGKGAHVQGFLDSFKKTAAVNIGTLNEWSKHGIPMIGLDPSLTLLYRDEYRQTGEKPTYKILLLQEFLAKMETCAKATPRHYRLFLHCTEKTMCPDSGRQWQSVFRKFGLGLEIVEAGCCGMAGAYGHEKEHVAHSKGLYDLSWRHRYDPTALATGYSCRSQISRCEGLAPRHPVEVLNDLF